MIRPNTNGIIVIMIIATTAVSILAQLPVFSSSLRPVMFIMWILSFIISVLLNQKIILNSFFKLYASLYLFLVFWAMVGDLLERNSSHLRGNYIYFLAIPLFIYFICLNSGEAMIFGLKNILLAYIIFAVILFCCNILVNEVKSI